MLKKDNFFKNYFIHSSKYYKNIKKTKKVFKSFLTDLKNFEIPLLESYEKNYKFDFSKATIKRFSKYKNNFVSGSNLVLENNIWLKVHQSIYAKETNINSNILYNFITNNNKIIINNIIFSDYIESSEIEELIH